MEAKTCDNNDEGLYFNVETSLCSHDLPTGCLSNLLCLYATL